MHDGASLEPTRDGLPPMPPGPPHEERHFTQHQVLRDAFGGAVDGLVAPFALATALAAAAVAGPVIVTAGLAVVAGGSLAAALAFFLSVRAEAAHYAAERLREEEEAQLYPDREKWEVAAILHRYGVRGDLLRQAVEAVASDRRKWVDFMMRFELELSEPDPHRAARSARTIGAAFAVAGLIPLLPYMLVAGTGQAMWLSGLLTAMALAGFGWLRARAHGLEPMRGALQSLAVGAAAAAIALLVALLVGR